jgi:hypothetical protein
MDFVAAVPAVVLSRNESVSPLASQAALEVGPLPVVSMYVCARKLMGNSTHSIM